MLTKFLEKFFPDSKFTKFWSNKRLRALVLLPLYLIFIAIAFSVIADQSQYVHPDEGDFEIKEEIVTFSDMKEEIYLYNFDYKLTVKNNDDITIYKGSSFNSDEAVLYKEDTNEINEFYKKDGKVYSVVLGVLNETILSDVEMLNLDYIFNKIENIEPDVLDDEFIFSTSDIYVKIKVLDNSFSTIEINENTLNLVYEFSNIGKITNISY